MKETNLQTFNLIASVEILGKNINLYNTLDNPLFLARDVAEWIDYAFINAKRVSRDVSKMIKNIDKDEKIKGICNSSEGKSFPLKNDSVVCNRKTFPITYENNDSNESSKFNSVYGTITPSSKSKSKARKTQNMWFLTEDGLYEVLMQSTKAEAKKLKKQIKNYLRDIRKTGGTVEYGSEEKFIESRFSNFSEDTKRAMVTELLASNKVLQEQNELLETDVKALKSEILTWNDRNKLNAGVRMLAAKTNHYIGTIWKQLYKELQYKHGIYLNSRKQNRNDSLISRVREEEWGMVMKTFNAMCADYGQSPTKMFQQTLNKN